LLQKSFVPYFVSSATVIVHLLDINDNFPEFRSILGFTINEELPINTYVGSVDAVDKDENDVLKYELVNTTGSYYKDISYIHICNPIVQ